MIFVYNEQFVMWLLTLGMEEINYVAVFEEYGILLLKYLTGNVYF